MTAEQPPGSSGRRAVGDIVGGFVAGLYSVPEGIGYASLAGISPMLGIYAGMTPVAIAAATTGSVLMMSTLTSAIALTVAGVLDQGAYPTDQVPQVVFTMTLLAGGIMVLLGLLRLGKVVAFISNAVMTGFVMGVAVLIMIGKLDEIVGYDPDGISNKVVKAVDILVHVGRWDWTTAAVGLATIAAAFGLKAIPALDRYALVLVVIAGTAIVWIFGIATPTIADQATIASGLDAIPIPSNTSELPSVALIPGLFVGSISIAIVALAQGAGISPAFPNPTGGRADASRDFLGQGLGNVAGAFFQSAPTGGSLSRTAVSAEGGATRRWAGLVAALSVLVLVVFAGSLVSHIPEAVIGGLLFVIGVELVVGRIPDARLAWDAGTLSRILFFVTLALTLTVPLQWAILVGTVLSLLAYIARGTASARLRRIDRDAEGWLLTDDIPDTLPADEPLIVRYTGPDFFAVVTSIVDHLPRADPDHPGVLVLDLGRIDRYSSTMLKQFGRYTTDLLDAGSGLVVAGVTDHQREVLARAGIGQRIGSDNLLPRDPHIDLTIEQAFERGRTHLAELKRGKTR